MDKTESSQDSNTQDAAGVLSIGQTAELLQIPDGAGGVEAIAKLAREGSTIKVLCLPTHGLGDGLPDEVPLAIDVATHKVYSIKNEIEAYRSGPDRRRGTARVTTLASFIDLANRHKDDGSAIFADTKWPAPVAHRRDRLSWREQRAASWRASHRLCLSGHRGITGLAGS